MSGIICAASKNLKRSPTEFTKILENFFLGKQELRAVKSGSNFQAAVVSTPESAASCSCDEDLGISIIVDGYFIDCIGSGLSSSEWLLQKYTPNSNQVYSHLNGSFNVLIINHKQQEIKLITDRYGSRPLFIVDDDANLLISYRASILFDISDHKKAINQKLVANQLSYSRIFYGDETFFKGIQSVPKQAIITWTQNSGVKYGSYRPNVNNFVGEGGGSVDELTDLFKEVISDFSGISNVGLSLSGGLDSRVLLASGFQGPTFTWGYQRENDEIKLAKRCADVTSNPWNFIQLQPESFLDLNCDGDKLREGLDLFVQAHTFSVYPEIVKNNVTSLITGIGMGVFVSGCYNPSREINSFDEVLDFTKNKMQYFSKGDRKKLFKSDQLECLVSEIFTGIKSKLRESYRELGAVKSIESFFLEHRTRRGMFQRQQWQRAFCEDYIPSYDNRLIDYLATFKPEEKLNYRLSRQLLISLSKDLADIPYQKNNIPVSAPIKFWSDAERIELEKECLYRDIFNSSMGQCSIPYNRFYSNFDEWLRTNKLWMNQARSLLLGSDSRVGDYLQHDAMKGLIDDQESGKYPNFSKIVHLMSLEKTLRTNFD